MTMQTLFSYKLKDGHETSSMTVTLRRSELRRFVANLDAFGDDCGATCKRLRMKLRQHLRDRTWTTVRVRINYQAQATASKNQ